MLHRKQGATITIRPPAHGISTLIYMENDERTIAYLFFVDIDAKDEGFRRFSNDMKNPRHQVKLIVPASLLYFQSLFLQRSRKMVKPCDSHRASFQLYIWYWVELFLKSLVVAAQWRDFRRLKVVWTNTWIFIESTTTTTTDIRQQCVCTFAWAWAIRSALLDPLFEFANTSKEARFQSLHLGVPSELDCRIAWWVVKTRVREI